MYHGGTIFHNAASKYIHVENQVSLGVGETVHSKLKFEEWLWEEVIVSVKHYHSNNGVFTAVLFSKSWAERRQRQVFVVWEHSIKMLKLNVQSKPSRIWHDHL